MNIQRCLSLTIWHFILKQRIIFATWNFSCVTKMVILMTYVSTSLCRYKSLRKSPKLGKSRSVLAWNFAKIERILAKCVETGPKLIKIDRPVKPKISDNHRVSVEFFFTCSATLNKVFRRKLSSIYGIEGNGTFGSGLCSMCGFGSGFC